MREAAFRELDLESVLALWLGAAHGRLRRVAEVRRVGHLADERGLGLGRSPRFGADATQRDACPRHLAAGDRDDDGRRRQGELVRRPVAQLQIQLLTPRDGRWERDVRYQI